MEITLLSDARSRPRTLAVGEFDGVHLGHRAVIEGADTVLTFEPHPLAVTHPEQAPKLLTSLDVKAELVADLGVSELVVIPFDDRFALQTPQDFIDHVLVRALDAQRVSVGQNFRFGHGAKGRPDLLATDPRFATRVVTLVQADGEIVSSSHIRALIAAGEVGRAARFLGAPFQLRGTVVHGDQRGRTLGFPTANIVPDEQLVCPGFGVYAALADGRPAAVSIGVRPTFGDGRSVLVEAFVIDADVDLYGRTLRLDFLARLRGELRFDSVEELVAQMQLDVDRARAICAG
jgi:riboflavin kinase / FMN adenylyltransferase